MGTFDDITDASLTRPDGRTVAWTEWGDRDGRPLLRLPGTPGCRWSVRADRTPWIERNLRVLTTERPGFGRSTALPGRGFAEHADDLAALLDHVGVDRVHVVGGSGAAPHELMFCQRHPDRVLAATVLVGMAPVEDEEAARMIDLNQRARSHARAGDRDGLVALLAPVREAMLVDPLAAFRGVMDVAPPDDQAVMGDPGWQETFVRAATEALEGGVDGWVDESMALSGDWSEIDPSSITTSITWQHAASDVNCPQSAALRLVDDLPNARFVAWPHDAGHLYGYHHEGEILDELLAR